MILAALLAAALQGGLLTGGVRGTVRISQGDPAETVVYLLPETPDAGAPGDSVVIDQRELRFLPKVIAVAPGTPVLFRNSDPVLHNVFSPPGRGPGFDLGTYPRPGSRVAVFNEPGQHVVLCHVHPEMVAYVLVVPSRWMTTVSSEQRYEFREVPPGRYQLVAWRPRSRPVERLIDVTAGVTLRIDLELTPRRREE